MKVGLNATCLNDRPSGAKQRFVGIYRELVALAPEIEFVVYEPSDCNVASWFQGAPNVTARKTPVPSQGRLSKVLNGLGYWRAELARQRFDILEGMNLPLVTSPVGRNLLTIHDLRCLQPEAGKLERLVFKAALTRALHAADHVVTVSESMKKAILNFNPGIGVSVVYNGMSSGSTAPLSLEDVAAFQEKFAIVGGYVLAVGHNEARKNYPRLIDAMARLHARGIERNLVIIGNDSGERDALEQRIQARGLAGRVQMLSGLSDLEVRCAYASCGLFVFPSSYEGFGIPILEAMAAGRPIVLSNIDVFREITQGQGIYFAPTDDEQMALSIEQVLLNREEQERIIAYGNSRLTEFSYRHLASRMMVIYQSLQESV